MGALAGLLAMVAFLAYAPRPFRVPVVDLEPMVAIPALPDTTQCRTIDTYPWASNDSTVVMLLCGGLR